MSVLEILKAAEDLARSRGLDYSESSLVKLDEVFSEPRTPELLRSIAAYLGEVYCRNLKGTWFAPRGFDTIPAPFVRIGNQNAYVIEAVNQRVTNPDPIKLEAIYRVAKSAIVGRLVVKLDEGPAKYRRRVTLIDGGREVGTFDVSEACARFSASMECRELISEA